MKFLNTKRMAGSGGKSPARLAGALFTAEGITA